MIINVSMEGGTVSAEVIKHDKGHEKFWCYGVTVKEALNGLASELEAAGIKVLDE